MTRQQHLPGFHRGPHGIWAASRDAQEGILSESKGVAPHVWISSGGPFYFLNCRQIPCGRRVRVNATVTSRAQVLAVPLLFWLFWEARAWGPQGSVLTRGVVQGGCHGALVASVGVVLKFAQTLDHILIYVRLKEPDFGEPGLLRSQIAVLDGRVLQGTLEGSRRPRLCECCVVKWQMLGCTPSLSGGIKPVFGAPCWNTFVAWAPRIPIFCNDEKKRRCVRSNWRTEGEEGNRNLRFAQGRAVHDDDLVIYTSQSNGCSFVTSQSMYARDRWILY